MTRMGRLRSIAFVVVALGANAIAQPRDDRPSIIVAGIIEARRLTVTAGDIGKLPKRAIQVQTAKGTSTFEGVALQSVLELAGVLFGQQLQGARLMAFVAVEGAPPSLQEVSSTQHAWGNTYRALFRCRRLTAVLARSRLSSP